jgi:DNA-binding transcriptional MerR regulator
MLTVTELARRCGLSRTALLYYERQGLLRKPPRTTGNYRAYGEQDEERLRQVGRLRKLGLSVADIRVFLTRSGGTTAAILQRRLAAIDHEIESLRTHQRAILGLLNQTRTPRRIEMLTKETFVAVMRGAGMTDADMDRWHSTFEKDAPQEHQEFLEFLHISPEEITKIREWSRKGARG